MILPEKQLSVLAPIDPVQWRVCLRITASAAKSEEVLKWAL